MREKNKNGLESGIDLHDEDAKYTDSLNLDYCGFRLKSLAEKIKSGLKFKKSETRFINP